jgi:hypothetical protein
MKKAILFLSLVTLFFIHRAFAAVTIRYYNKDSQTHTMKVSMDGSTKEVKFDGSKTSSVTIQGSGTKCVIETSCGKVEVKDGANIEIKNGCITVN